MHNLKTIYAVIWIDGALGLPLSLHKDSAESAIELAQAIHEKTKNNPLKVQHLRAVSLADDSDKLVTLWKDNN